MPLDPTPFTPWMSLFGGILIGLSALMVLGLLGRIAGISGIAWGAMRPEEGRLAEWGWRAAFIAGLVAAPVLLGAVGMGPIAHDVPDAPVAMIAAGLLVGVGTILGSGCTSGHGVCGLARLSPRSMVAVPMFMAAAGLTVFVIRHLIAGGAA